MSESNQIAVSVKSLTKIYKLYAKPSHIAKEILHPFRKKYHTDFYALNDINFSIKKGETVGVIGQNGAGKSTLLKIITGVLTPTDGTSQVNGRVSSLLELGAGFNPQYTGIENVYLQGTLMGLSHKEMKQKIDNILRFADIGNFVYQPVKSYSSGMFARLAFATAINVEPDILIVDEALSVGDAAFQMKCFKKFQDFQKQKKTILFVTHALDTIIRYCNRGVLMHNGKIVCDGGAKKAVDTFKKVLSGNFNKPTQKETTSEAQRSNNQYIFSNTKKLKDSFQIPKEVDSYGNGMADIVDFGILNDKKEPSAILDFNSNFEILMRVRFNKKLIEPIFAFTIKDSKGLEITGTNTSIKYFPTGEYRQGEEVSVFFKQKANLQLGKYALSLGCVAMNEKGVEVYCRYYDAIFFEVVGSEQMVGLFDLRSKIYIE